MTCRTNLRVDFRAAVGPLDLQRASAAELRAIGNAGGKPAHIPVVQFTRSSTAASGASMMSSFRDPDVRSFLVGSAGRQPAPAPATITAAIPISFNDAIRLRQFIGALKIGEGITHEAPARGDPSRPYGAVGSLQVMLGVLLLTPCRVLVVRAALRAHAAQQRAGCPHDPAKDRWSPCSSLLT